VLLIILVLCVFLFVCKFFVLRLVWPMLTDVSELFIFDYPFGFSLTFI
jgi:uncharacterized membrane protein YccF (DUF307 family)